MFPDSIKIKLNGFFQGEFTDEFLKETNQNSDFLELKKGEILFSDKDSKSQNFLILKGSLVRFIITDSGEQKAVSFHTENFSNFVGKAYIKTEDVKIQHFVKINEPAQLLAVNTDFVKIALGKYPFFAQKIYSVLLEYLQTTSCIQDHYLGLNRKDFLAWFLEKYPLIFQRFQSKDIANFMGITPEWLSKLKRKILME